MLFDLQGKRRRLVQVTYLTLAILMGGGLVLFGIGSDVQGGLADIFGGGSSSDQSGDQVIEDQLASAEADLEANPQDAEALETVVQTNVQLARTTDQEAAAAGQLFEEGATPQLEAAADAWERYVEAERKPDDSIAFLMTQVYGPQGLDEGDAAVEAAKVVAEERNTPEGYLALVQTAAIAGDQKEIDAAAERATALAPKSQRKQIEKQVTAIEAAAAAQAQAQAGAGGQPLPEGLELPQGGGGGSGGQGSGETDGGSQP
jgi:hypothetical protein